MGAKHFSLLIVLAAIWGASFLFLRLASPEFGPIPLVFVRTLLAAITLIFFLEKGGLANLFKRWPVYFIVGGLGTSVPFCLISYSALSLSAGFMSILNAMTPIFSAVVAYFLLSEDLTRNKVMGLLIGFCGVIVLSARHLNPDDLTAIVPLLLVLCSAMFYAYSSCYSKLKLSKVSAVEVALGSQFYAALTTLPLAIYFWPSELPSLNAWLITVVLAIVCTALAIVMFFHLIKEIGVSHTLMVTYLIPVFGIIWGYLFLNEAITTPMLIGGGLILFGVAVTSRTGKK